MTDTTQETKDLTVEQADQTTNENALQKAEVSADERVVSPRSSVYETPEKVVLELEMPGVNRDSIDIQVEADELRISGRRFHPSDEGYTVIHRERTPFSYRRTFLLGDRIDTSAITAAYQDGVLTVTLPKIAKAQPRKITVE